MSLNYKELNEFIQFFSRIDEDIASFITNIAFEGHTPITELSNRYCLEIKANGVNDNGFPINEDMDLIYKIEDELNEELASLEIVKVGSVTYSGLRQLYFYGTEEIDFEKITNSIMKKYNQFQFDSSKLSDPSWEFYTGYLFPTEYERQSYYTSMVINNLRTNGDNLEAPRNIDFHLVFENNNDMNNAVEQIKSLGFGVEAKEDNGNFIINATKNSAVQPDITPLVNSLIEVATECNGYFDGWGCTIAE